MKGIDKALSSLKDLKRRVTEECRRMQPENFRRVWEKQNFVLTILATLMVAISKD